MDIENLKRAAEIERQLTAYKTALRCLDGENVSVSVCGGRRRSFAGAILSNKGFLKDFRCLIHEHIDVLLEEAKTL